MYKKDILSKRQIYRKVSANVRQHLKNVHENTLHQSIQNKSQNFEKKHRGSCTLHNVPKFKCYICENKKLESSLRPFPSVDNLSCMETVHNNKQILCSNKNEEDKYNLSIFLRSWALKYNISHMALTSLLKFLNYEHPELPASSKTLLKSPNTYTLRLLDNGDYIHFGFKNLLDTILPIALPNNIKHIRLSFNIDGLPIFNSSNTQFWPILADISDFKNSIFVIGIFCGTSKPSPLFSYLELFIRDLKNILQTGVIYNEEHFIISIKHFICDMPARAYLKCVKSHAGYSSCDKCICNGSYIDHRVVFDDLTCALRTDESFVMQLDEDHYVGISPLLELKIGMVTCFPIDYMHSVCLGVMRKIIHSWVKPTKYESKHVKLDSRSINVLNERLQYIRRFVPIKFNRKPGGLNELDHWKATEFRTFLLYLGPIILFDILEHSVYNHFMLLHCSIYVLVHKYLSIQYSSYIKNFLKTFVEQCKSIYGSHYLIYYVHSLIHLVNDVDRFGNLDKFSAFKFENYLGTLKRSLRASYKPLQQAANRVSERDVKPVYLNMSNYYSFTKEHCNGPVPSCYLGKQYQQLSYDDYVFRNDSEADRSLETQNRNVIDVDICEDVLVDSVTNISDDVSNTNFVMSAETNAGNEDDPAKLTLAYERLFEIPRTIVERFAAHVKYLDISHNKIVDITPLVHFEHLSTLIADDNLITENSLIPPLPKLQVLWLNRCKIKTLFPWLKMLQQSCSDLKYLCLMGNPAAPSYLNGGTFYEYLQYRLFVISQFPSLVHLDDRAITDDQRMEAQKLFKKPFFERFIKPGGSSISSMMGRSVTWSSISTFWNKNQNPDENRRNLVI